MRTSGEPRAILYDDAEVRDMAEFHSWLEASFTIVDAIPWRMGLLAYKSFWCGELELPLGVTPHSVGRCRAATEGPAEAVRQRESGRLPRLRARRNFAKRKRISDRYPVTHGTASLQVLVLNAFPPDPSGAKMTAHFVGADACHRPARRM